MEYNSIQELVKKIDCWRFWGYCLVASYQYYRICATFMIKRQRWADVHRHLRRLFPEGESTSPQEVLARLRSLLEQGRVHRELVTLSTFFVTTRWITRMSSNGYWAGCDVESYRPG